jgi:hypothetical protein
MTKEDIDRAAARKQVVSFQSGSAPMSSIQVLLPLTGLLVIMQPACADDRDDCASHGGTLLIATVISGPRFVHGHDLRGVELSHTPVRLRGDDGRIYDIAIDDIFAEGYDQAAEQVISNFAVNHTLAAAEAWTGCIAIAATSRHGTSRMDG